MCRKFLFLLGLALPLGFCAAAQDSYEEFLKNRRNEYSNYKKNVEDDFAAYRAKINAEYTQFMRERWKAFSGEDAIPVPEQEPPVPPTVAPKEDQERPAVDRPVTIDKIIKKPIAPINVPQPVVRIDKEPQPLPVVPPTPKEEPAPMPDKPLPVKEEPLPEGKKEPTPVKKEPVPEVEKPVTPADNRFAFSFYGTDCRIRLYENQKFTLKNTQENSVADMWERLCTDEYTDMVADCLRLKAELNLCDWAYLKMAKVVGDSFLRPGSDESTLLQMFILNQSGYRTRLARGNDNHLYMLVASDYTIYGKRFFRLDNVRFYLLQPYEDNTMHIFDRKFPNDCALNLAMNETPRFAVESSAERTLTAKRFPEVSASVSTNKNLMDFLSDYPSSAIDNDENTKWTIFADIPLSPENRERLYPALRQAIAGKSEEEAANMIINFVQTAFVYEYDDKVWGGDRIFAADETLYYPYSDCEDRAILFTRIIRDVMGLETALVYYPGHLAAAVRFNEEIPGDYFVIGDKRYLICDPTFIGANIGRTMTGMDNSRAQVILLNR